MPPASAALIIALTSPVLGAIADATGPRKPWILLFSIVGIIGCWMLWYAMPGSLMIPMLGIILALVGMEYAAVFNNAMMPTLVPRSELGRLSGSAWGLGYIGGLISLVIVLGLLSANPDTGQDPARPDAAVRLDPATHEGDRASGPLTAMWYVDLCPADVPVDAGRRASRG
jgi:UMF1 family MFS transporter